MSNYNIYELQNLLSRSLSEASRRSLNDFNKTIYWGEDIVEKVGYTINNHGYRSSEFDSNNEILVLGCSQTYGAGMPDEFTWPSIFANSINKKYSRIAIQGDSIGAQVYKAFKYFEEIGNPKVILGLFPLFRLEYISVPGKFISSVNSGNTEQERLSINIAFFYEEYMLKLSKAPHDPEYILPREFVMFYNFMFIKMLEQYCESHNIKFIWSIYDNIDIETTLRSDRNILNNYVQTCDLLQIAHLKHVNECDLNKNKHCSIDYKDHKLYNHAADYDKSKGFGHFGIHLHGHIAQRFIEKYKGVVNDK